MTGTDSRMTGSDPASGAESIFGPSPAQVDGPAPEVAVSKDMIKRGLIVGPVIVAVCGVIWGADGVWSSLYALALVLGNFAFSAGLIAVAAKIGLAAIMGAAMFGYLARLGIVFVAFWIVKDESWISLFAFGSTIIITHLGLLVWELRYVALSLAHPGLKPPRP